MMGDRRWASGRIIAWPATLLWLMFAACVAAAAERPLASLVPESAGLTIEVQQPTHRWQQLSQGALFQRFQQHPALQQWSAKHGGQLARVVTDMGSQLGLSRDDLWNKLLGQRILLAAWPEVSPGEEPPAMLLVEAADAALLTRLLERLQQVLEQSGQAPSLVRITAGGVEYRVLTVQSADSKPPVSLVAAGQIGIVTTSQEVMQQTLDLLSQPADAAGSLAAMPSYREGMARLPTSAVARFFLNPRRFDAAMSADLDQTPADELAMRRAVISIWKASRYWVAALEVDENVRLESYLHFDRAALHPRLQAVFQALGDSSRFLERVPREALVAVAGRLDLPTLAHEVYLAEMAKAGQPAAAEGSSKKPTEWFLIDTLLRPLAPHLGAYLVTAEADPSATADAPRLPVQWVAGVALVDSPNDPRANAAKALAHLTTVTARVVALVRRWEGESPDLQVVAIPDGSLQVISLKGLSLPGGYVATYVFTPGYLFVGTSQAVVKAAAKLAPEESLASMPGFQRLLNPRLGEPSHLLYVHIAGLRQVFSEHPEMAEVLAASKGMDAAQAEQSWQKLLALTRLADHFVAAIRCDAQGLSFSAQLSAEGGSLNGEE